MAADVDTAQAQGQVLLPTQAHLTGAGKHPACQYETSGVALAAEAPRQGPPCQDSPHL